MNDHPLPDAVAALFPEMPDRNRIEEWLTGELQQALQRLKAGPVVPTIDIAPGERLDLALDGVGEVAMTAA